MPELTSGAVDVANAPKVKGRAELKVEVSGEDFVVVADSSLEAETNHHIADDEEDHERLEIGLDIPTWCANYRGFIVVTNNRGLVVKTERSCGS